MAKLSEKTAGTTITGGYVHIIVPDGGEPTGFRSERIKIEDYFSKKVKTIMSISTSQAIDATYSDTIIEATGTITITLPNSLATGFCCDIVNVGTGVITLAASTTLQTKDSNTKLASQYGGASIYHAGSNVWRAVGDLSA